MKILILGGTGMLGPWVVKALKDKHQILLTDIKEPPKQYQGDFLKLSVDDLDGVIKAAEGMDCIVNLAVLRHDRKLAFDVSTKGNYSIMEAAKQNNIKRVINTGPHFQLVGPSYEEWDHNLNPDMPAQPGTRLYAISKYLGQEICKKYSDQYGIKVLTLLYYNMRHHLDLTTPDFEPAEMSTDMTPFTTSWIDCGEAIRCAVEVAEDKLASNLETFFITPNLPHKKFNSEKTYNILGWKPRYSLERLWNKEIIKSNNHLEDSY
ncbi:MAG: NAD-dependent epimerase/dehydratase family protein [Dehalococcoidales bacterium]|nr:NAD-dependent epimerase/dehydratase family protein [Dehalococcoidales bacterium]